MRVCVYAQVTDLRRAGRSQKRPGLAVFEFFTSADRGADGGEPATESVRIVLGDADRVIASIKERFRRAEAATPAGGVATDAGAPAGVTAPSPTHRVFASPERESAGAGAPGGEAARPAAAAAEGAAAEPERETELGVAD